MSSLSDRPSESPLAQTAETHANAGATLLESGQLDEAEASYRAVLELDPDCAQAYFKLGNIALKRGLLAEAEASYRRAIDIAPDYAKALYNLGCVLQQQSRLMDAEVSYRRVIAIQPDYADAHINLGVVFVAQGRYVEAEESYRSALRFAPDHAIALSNLSVALKEQGRLGEAEVSCNQALAIAPANADAHNNMGMILKEQGRLADAEASYREALDQNPNHAEALNNLGITLKAQGRFGEAEKAYRRSIEIRPTYVNAYNNLGIVLTEQGRSADAEMLYRRVLELDAKSAQTHNLLGGMLANLGRPKEAAASFRRALQLDPTLTAAHSNLLFALNYCGADTDESRLEEAQRYGRTVTGLVRSRFSKWSCPANPRRLRVGLVSADLRFHPVGFFLDGLLAHIDKSRFDLIAYPTGRAMDEMTVRMRKHFMAWRPIADLNNEGAAQLIHADRIHILLDLSGHTTDNRLPVFGWKPAPVQATWLGYFATTGVAEIDYLLATRIEVPDNNQDQFTEAIWYLPETRLCFTAPQADIPVTNLPAQHSDNVTFGCFQNLSKIGDEVLDTWARILAALPAARLRFQCSQLDTEDAQQHLLQRLQQFGVDPERVSMHGALSRDSYLAAHAEVDIILDTFPYPGGTTTCEALWMGVPTLTLAGHTMLERQGASFLSVAGLPQWIAASKADYITKALDFARDLTSLAALRSNLRQQVLASPLFDAPRFARNLEQALWQMWQQSGPASNTVPAK